MSEGGQFRLLGQRRYGPFFWAVSLGTLNDNVLKVAITLMLTFQVSVPWLPVTLVGPLTGALFILPSLLLSATAGQWADKWPLDRLIRLGKVLEVLMMVLAAIAVCVGYVWALLGCLLLSGIHVTVFSTLKYAYVPQHVAVHELMGANGLLEMGLFTAIVLGSLVGGVLVAPQSLWLACPVVMARAALPVALIALALAGWWFARTVPNTPAVDPTLRIDFNPMRETWRHLKIARQQGDVLWALLGISWMWFFGASFLSLFPGLAHDVLHAQSSVATWLLALISLGMGGGALMCERLTRGRTPLFLVPLGGLGMAAFGADLAWSIRQLEQVSRFVPVGGWTLWAFLMESSHTRLMVDVCLMALSVGWFSVPLYALMQARAQARHRARIVAANNILNAMFILLSAGLGGALLAAGLSMGDVLAVTVALHAVVCGVVCWQLHGPGDAPAPWLSSKA